MTDSEITTAILREIRDEIGKTNTRLDTLTGRVDGMNGRLDQLVVHADITNQRLSVVESTLTGLAGQMVFLTRYVKNKQDVEIQELRHRIERLEHKVG